MNYLGHLQFLLHITQARSIARRYFVTNGFDAALTMLGLIMGFYISGGTAMLVAVNACVGAAIALGMSGLSSAYLSETAERQKELRELEQALVTDLGNSDYGQATRYVPIIIAVINGFAPLLISLFIIVPLWLAYLGVQLPFDPLNLSIALAFVAIFILGVFLGRISGTGWLWMGFRTTFVGLLTISIILLLKL